MTATPIPRTAAMTVYGDLDVTELSELPPGRTPIQTRWIDDEESEVQMWEHVRAEVAKGHRAYVVCPLVHPGEQQENADGAQVVDAEGSQAALPGMSGSGAAAGAQAEAADAARVLRAATEEVERLGGAELVGCRLGLLHGQMRAVDKERVMAEFRDGAIDVLVATTVIEVGVDVASATVIVVEDADRFGIAQLHQLRGRVGRGKLASSCYLLAPASEETPAAMRLRALERTTDGFELAEVDLELRGEGTVLGIRQNGRNELRLASLRTDRELIVRARSLAESVLDRDRDLSEHPRFAEELRLFVRDGDAAYLFKS